MIKKIKTQLKRFWKYIVAVIFGGAVLAASLGGAVEPVLTIREQLVDKTPIERNVIKVNKIVKIDHIGTFEIEGLEIEIRSVEKKIIDGIDLVEVKARAWWDEPIGFGDGTIEIETFRIVNPPILVDDPAGDIIVEAKSDRFGILEIRTLKEDPKQALLESLARIIGITGKDGKDIIESKVGQTSTTCYSNSGGDGEVYNGGDVWATIRDGASGTNEAAETVSSAYSEDSGDVWMGRFFLPFDCSAVPDTDTVSAVTVQVYGTDSILDDNDAYAYVGLTESTEVDPTSLSDDDWNNFTDTVWSNTIAIGSWNAAGFNTLTFDATGRTNFSKITYTKTVLREGHDIEDNSGISGSDYVQGRSANYDGTSSDPIMTVTHAASSTRNRLIIIE